MTKLLSNILSGSLRSNQYSIASYGPCQVGLALMPREEFAKLPMDAFVLPAQGTHRRLEQMVGPGYIQVYSVPSWSDIREIQIAPVGTNLSMIESIVDRFPKDQEEACDQVKHAATCSLIVAKQEGLGSVAFDATARHTLEEPVAVLAMLAGIQQYFSDPSDQPLQGIVIRVSDIATLEAANWFIDELTARHGVWTRMVSTKHDEDDQAEVVEAYLESKNRNGETLPALIASQQTLMPGGQFVSEESSVEYVDTYETRVEEGYVRLIPNDLLDRAMSQVPEVIRTVDPDLPKPYYYARLRRRLDTASLSGTYLALERTFSIQSQESGLQFIIGGIGLTDVRRETLQHSSLLYNSIIAPSSPALTAQLLRFHAGTDIIPEDVFRRIIDGVPFTPTETLDAEELDRVLMAQVIHECAEIFWYAIPSTHKERWARIYPLKKERPGDFVHYRQMLRSYIESDFDFAKESFADKLSIFWNQAIPRLFQEQGLVLTDEEKGFFEELMLLAETRRAKYGSAFAVEE